MTERAGFAMLQDVLMADEFPQLDLALRGGRHVDRDELAWYQLLTDAQEHLEPYYRRYGCELIHKSDGYFYLLPTGEGVPRRHLAVGDMIVGQALALLYLDPASVERGGLVTKEQVVGQLVAVLGEGGLVQTFHARKRRVDERVAHKVVRARVGEAVRRLAGLGFVDLVGGEGEQVRLRAALMRFAEPVRGTGAPAEALARLVAEGEAAMAGGEAEGEGEPEGEGDAEAEGEPEAEREPELDEEPEDDA